MSTIVRISPAGQKGWSVVLVESAYAEKFYRYLRGYPLGTTPLRNAEQVSIRVDATEAHELNVIFEDMDESFEIQAAPHALFPLVKQWVASLESSKS